MHKLRVTNDIAELIRKMHPQLKSKVKASLQLIIADLHSGKALKDELAGLWSFRVGRFRIIYRIGDGKFIEIVAVGPRDRIYEETFKLIQKGDAH